MKRSESSFTILETVIALGLMVGVIIEVTAVQGKSILFSEYNQRSTKALWLAKSLMSKIEWGHSFYDSKELKMDVKDQSFDKQICPDTEEEECDYRYNILIEEFPLPIVDLITGSMFGGGSEEGGEDDGGLAGAGDMIKKQVKEYLGDEILKVAKVEVYWPEGSQRESVELAMILTSQNYLDEQIYLQKPIEGDGKSDESNKGNNQTNTKTNKNENEGKKTDDKQDDDKQDNDKQDDDKQDDDKQDDDKQDSKK